LAIDPANPEHVLLGYHFGVMESTNGGGTWTALPSTQGDAMSLQFHPTEPSTLYLAGHEVFQRSADGGATWQPMSTDLPGLDIHAFVLHPTSPQTMYAFVVGFGLFVSQDSGATWLLLDSSLPSSILSLAVVPKEIDLLYAASPTDGMGRSSDQGQTWLPVGRIGEAQAVWSLAYSSATSTLYAGTDKGIFRSNDGGQSWMPTTLTQEVLAIAVSPSDPSVLMAVTSKGQLFRSRDGGLTWPGR
jgi:photosystem II stability/assembly factor-like uncharacterized protein